MLSAGICRRGIIRGTQYDKCPFLGYVYIPTAIEFPTMWFQILSWGPKGQIEKHPEFKPTQRPV